ncbi:MAG TPA: ATPase [Anaerolineaceae bacterium]|nr:ATPase [Anaerolineaceae bacterium]
MLTTEFTSPNHKSFSGLTEEEVLARRQEFGKNILPEEKKTQWWTILLNQFKSPLIYIILAAALISLVLRETQDFIIIMIVVIADTILGFFQEYQAQNTYLALKSLLKPMTTVIRITPHGPERKEVEIWELVPGDLVVLNAGEKVPADGVILEAVKLSVDESILTGESEPVRKSPIEDPKNPTDVNRLFMGTTIVTGRVYMRVVHTGTQTELGKIAASIHEGIEEETPLQIRLKNFSKSLTRIVVIFTLAILISGLIMGREFFEMLRTSIILAIAAVPEGLLIAVTLILVLGMRKILKRNGLVKRLLAVETLGSVTTICTDKTGTLTEGRMRVNHTDIVDKQRALQTMVLCNNLEGPVDVALWEYAQGELNGHAQELFDSAERLDEELFTSETKFMITINRLENGEQYNFLKGAPEIVLDMCQVNPQEKARIIAEIDAWASQGLRTLGLAYRPISPLENHTSYIWLGLLGMEDPIREGVLESVEVAQHAGIRVVMITGDYQKTAERIGRNLGLFRDGDRVIDGEELKQMSDEQLQKEVGHIVIFARIRPNDKLRIIKALQANDEVTAMIGDGVNDAPALKRANIGVVVGSATDVAKETADLVLLDNNFRTIVAAIEEGRTIFQNIRKVVAYTLSNSFAEVLAIFAAMLLGWPAPLTVAQILWIHLICDGPSDIILGFEPTEPGIMDEKPKPKNAPILTRLGYILIAVISITSSVFALLIFNHYSTIHGSPIAGRSIVFASLAINSMVYIFAYRSMRKPLNKMVPLKENMYLIWTVLLGIATALLPFLIPNLGEALGVVPLAATEWATVAGIAVLLLGVVEAGKYFANRLHNND